MPHSGAEDVRRTTQSTLDFLAGLDADQKAVATARFDVPDHRQWTYLPGPRPGLALLDMTAQQQDLAFALLDSGCSASGAASARGIIELEPILRQLDTGRAEESYWFRVLGEPSDAAPWAWRHTTPITTTADRPQLRRGGA